MDTISANELGKQMAGATIEQVVYALSNLDFDQEDVINFWDGFQFKIAEHTDD